MTPTLLVPTMYIHCTNGLVSLFRGRRAKGIYLANVENPRFRYSHRLS